MLEQAAIKAAIVQPLMSSLGLGLSGGGVGLLSLLPKFASGTDSAPGGLAIVGERGPELVNLPRGSQVIPNNIVAKRGSSSSGPTNISYSIDARGADSGTVERIKTVLSQHARAISGQERAMKSAQRFQATGVG
jgi:phage-related tail protein